MHFLKRARHKLCAARTLSRGDWTLLMRAWVLLLAVDLGLRVLPFGRVQAFLTAGHASTEAFPPSDAPDTISRLQRLVNVASRNHLYPMQCLRQALVLRWLLDRQGIRTDLRFGVRKESGELHAHAWLEHEGQPIGEPQRVTARFAPLASAPPER